MTCAHTCVPFPCAVAERISRVAKEEDILAIQIFDQKKFKKKDQGFLGVINVRVGQVIELNGDIGGDGESKPALWRRSAHVAGTDVHCQRCSREI